MPTALGKKFDKILRWARKQSIKPFKIRPMKKLAGSNQGEMVEHKLGDKTWYVIHIPRNGNLNAAVDTLFHEIAHINDITKNGWGANHSAEHSDEWGKEYSRIYRDYYEAKDGGKI